jgi:hypothetical protein
MAPRAEDDEESEAAIGSCKCTDDRRGKDRERRRELERLIDS